MDTSARQRGFEIRVCPLLGELPKAIEPHQPVCQLYRWQLGPNMWSSPTTKSSDPIVVTAHRVGFQGKATDPPHVDLPAIVRSQRHGQRRSQGKYIHISYMLGPSCLVDGQVSGMGTVHPLLTISFFSTWILPLHIPHSTLKKKSSSSAMDGLQRRMNIYIIK